MDMGLVTGKGYGGLGGRRVPEGGSNEPTCEPGAITFAHIFQKIRLRTVFIWAQKCVSFVHSISVTFTRMFLHLLLGKLLVFYYI